MIDYDRSGAGAPLLLIHGLGGDRHIWEPVAARLAADRDVVAIDMPGFGVSDPIADGEPTPARLAQEIARWMRAELGWSDAHVAGNSLGAWVGLELARIGAARSVTAIAPAGFWAGPLGPRPMLMRNLSRGLLPVLPMLLRSRAFRNFGLAGSVAHPDRVPYAAAVQMARAYAGSPGFAAVNAAMRASHFARGEEIDVPVTIAWCEHDGLVSRPKTPRVRGREVVLRDCGHVPMYDDPEAVAAVILQTSDELAATT